MGFWLQSLQLTIRLQRTCVHCLPSGQSPLVSCCAHHLGPCGPSLCYLQPSPSRETEANCLVIVVSRWGQGQVKAKGRICKEFCEQAGVNFAWLDLACFPLGFMAGAPSISRDRESSVCLWLPSHGNNTCRAEREPAVELSVNCASKPWPPISVCPVLCILHSSWRFPFVPWSINPVS